MESVEIKVLYAGPADHFGDEIPIQLKTLHSSKRSPFAKRYEDGTGGLRDQALTRATNGTAVFEASTSA